MDTVTYSRNIFIPLTNACRNRCAYCGFRSSTPFLLTQTEVREMLESAEVASEALFTFGEKPEAHPEIASKLEELGFKDFVSYIVEMNKMAISMGFLPHTNAGILTKQEIKKLKPFNASLGLMLEQAVELDCHSESPGKEPKVRIETIKRAGRESIPFTTGLLIGIGENPEDRLYSLEVINDLHLNYGHIQEVIIQNFRPKKGTEMASHTPPSTSEIVEVVREAREILYDDITIQIPPNLVGDVQPFISAGARDIGGISEADHINPEHEFPSIEQIERSVGDGLVLKERLPIYPQYIEKGWYSKEVSGVVNSLSDEEGYRCSNNT
ncbi:MAG: 7,8-didemethyl-8-hydroxy-5-deazariboflavin synthase subunit CofG [Archaeoglobaceae archaeon]